VLVCVVSRRLRVRRRSFYAFAGPREWANAHEGAHTSRRPARNPARAPRQRRIRAASIDLLEDPTFKVGLRKRSPAVYSASTFSTSTRRSTTSACQEPILATPGTPRKHRGKWDSFAIFRVGRVRYLKDIDPCCFAPHDPGKQSWRSLPS